VTPAARLAAAIEVLDQIAASRGPADGVLKAWGRNHRFAGSKDRRAIAEAVYDALRAQALSRWAMGAEDGRALVLGLLAFAKDLPLDEVAALFSGDGYGPAALTDDERHRLTSPPTETPDWVRAGVPEWVAERFAEQFGDDWMNEAKAAILPRAPVDLRVNALCGDVDGALRLLAHEEVKPERTPISALGLRLPPAFARDVQGLKAFTTGWIEVQDEASQIAAALAGAASGMTVIDYCAGGGGKTLALAASLRREGRLIASDVNAKRLDAMRERLERAGAAVEVRELGSEGEGMDDLEAAADLVFVDAPCSGSGTWRRHPEAAWRLAPEDITRLASLQAAILPRAARLVKPGGRLLYATCSLFVEENEAVAAAFAAAHPDFAPLPIARAVRTDALTPEGQTRLAAMAGGAHTLRLTPHTAGTDGFFVALFERLP
jgi:16S rRNA (cytosine967-C5)-methyltransferase